MKTNRILGLLALSILLLVVLAGCEPSTPEATRSPLVSPLATTSVVPTPVPSKCAEGCVEPSEGCLIKGVVTGMGDKYYYLPSAEGYEDALLLIKYGGRWFCTEQEAIQNGFQKPPQQ